MVRSFRIEAVDSPLKEVVNSIYYSYNVENLWSVLGVTSPDTRKAQFLKIMVSRFPELDDYSTEEIFEEFKTRL